MVPSNQFFWACTRNLPNKNLLKIHWANSFLHFAFKIDTLNLLLTNTLKYTNSIIDFKYVHVWQERYRLIERPFTPTTLSILQV